MPARSHPSLLLFPLVVEVEELLLWLFRSRLLSGNALVPLLLSPPLLLWL
jgi:hypothetical protein